MSLKQHFSKVPALKGKSFAYRNKRMGERDSLHITISLEELIKTVHAFRYGPDDMHGGSAYLFNTDKSGGYFKLFGDGVEIKTALTTDEFHDIAAVWFLCEEVRKLWKARPIELQIPALERRWLVFWAVGESLRVIYGNTSAKLTEDLRRLANPFWLDDKDQKGEHFRATIERHFRLGTEVLKKAYAQAEKVEGFSHRNWFRSESTLKATHAELESFSVLTSQLSDQYSLSKS